MAESAGTPVQTLKGSKDEGPAVVLASASPRRRELLAQIGVACEVRPVDVEEVMRAGESAEDFVVRLAVEKAQAGWARYGREANLPVLGADTVVVRDDQVMGKPCNRDEAIDMLLRLSGDTHRVLSAVAVATQDTQVKLSESRVTFRSIPREEAAAYWDTAEPADKAGGYAVQGLAAVFIERLDGSYSAVMGLPLFETAALLKHVGVDVIRQAAESTGQGN